MDDQWSNQNEAISNGWDNHNHMGHKPRKGGYGAWSNQRYFKGSSGPYDFDFSKGMFGGKEWGKGKGKF